MLDDVRFVHPERTIEQILTNPQDGTDDYEDQREGCRSVAKERRPTIEFTIPGHPPEDPADPAAVLW